MPDSICPVCGHPKPEGLAYCSLRCEERDPEPSPELDAYAARLASLQTLADKMAERLRDPNLGNVDRHFLEEDRRYVLAHLTWMQRPEPMEGATDGTDD